MSLRKLMAAACLLVHALAGLDVDVPPCAESNVAYNDWKRNSTPNGGYPSSAAECQRICQDTTYCEHFTYYNNTDGCWLQGDRVEKFFPDVYVVSGPSHCGNETEFTSEWSMRRSICSGVRKSSSPLGIVAVTVGLLAFVVASVVYFLAPYMRRQQDYEKSQVDPETGGGALLMQEAEEKDLLSMAQVTAAALPPPESGQSGPATPCFGSGAMASPIFAPCTASASATLMSNDILRRHEFTTFMASASR